MSRELQVKNARPSGLAVRFASLIFVAGLAIASGAAYGQSLDTVLHFDIKAQRLDRALMAFGQQAHMQVMIASDPAIAHLRTEELKGNYVARRVLAMLLNGSGFRFEEHARSIVIVADRSVISDPSAQSRKDLRSDTTAKGSAVDPPAEPTPQKMLLATKQTAEFSALQEVIVTAQKYRQRVYDVPISLQVIRGDELQQHGITSLSDLQHDVPGLYMDSTGTQHTVYLRGVGNELGTGAMVGQYIDDADITADTYQSGTQGYATGDNGLYDLSRVEVLKGPQGTLYGDGSMGGVIRYITNKPVLDRFQMSADAAALFSQYGAPGQRIETMLNTPLVQGALGLRLAGMFENDGGWVDEPAAKLKNVNGTNSVDVRAQALWQPTARFKAEAMQIVHRNTGGIGEGEDISGTITPLFGTVFVPNIENSSNLSNLRATYDFDGAQLLSSSTYLNGNENVNNEYSTEMIPKSPTYWIWVPYKHVNNDDFSQELRLVHTRIGPWQWSVGGFYKAYRDALFYPGDYVGLAGSSLSQAFVGVGQSARSSSKSWAAFANAGYEFYKRLTLGAGVRVFQDRETNWSALERGYLVPNSPRISVPTQYPTETFSSTDPRFYVQYRVTSHINAYASASKGFRSGGNNLTPAEPPYQPETLWSYDLGAKIRYPLVGLRADVDLFDMSYTNFVSDTYIPPTYLYTNVGKARIRGVDADLTWMPIDQWVLSLNTEILHTEFITATAVSGYASGDRLPFAPQYSFTASVKREFHWTDKPGAIEVYYYEISRVQYRLAGIPLFQSDILHFLNAHADVHWSNSLTLGVFAHNVLNDRGYESPLYYAGTSMRPRPRTFGVEFSVSFAAQ